MDNKVLLSISEITPVILELNSKGTLDLSALAAPNATVHFTDWANARTDQVAHIMLNDNEIIVAKVESVDPTTRSGTLQDQKIQTYSASGKLNYKIGKNSLFYRIITVDGSDHPNTFDSKVLEFNVVYDEESGSLKIDITEGAAAYTDEHKYLMPANIAIVRGVPGTVWKAHGDGRTRFQEVGGADSVLFQLDDKGVCPIHLIKIERIDVGPRSNAALDVEGDGITISREKDNTPLLTSPVMFGDYQAPKTGLSQFKSYCINTKGIADGDTISIISIIMQDTNIDEKLQVRIADELVFVKDTLRNNFNFMSNELDVDVRSKTAEFAVKSDKSGAFKIQISSYEDDASVLEITANFSDLS